MVCQPIVCRPNVSQPNNVALIDVDQIDFNQIDFDQIVFDQMTRNLPKIRLSRKTFFKTTNTLAYSGRAAKAAKKVS